MYIVLSPEDLSSTHAYIHNYFCDRQVSWNRDNPTRFSDRTYLQTSCCRTEFVHVALSIVLALWRALFSVILFVVIALAQASVTTQS